MHNPPSILAGGLAPAVIVKYLYCAIGTDAQVEMVQKFFQGLDIFVSLPPDFGKCTMIYVLCH